MVIGKKLIGLDYDNEFADTQNRSNRFAKRLSL